MTGRPQIYIKAPGYKITGYHTKGEFLDIVQYQPMAKVWRRFKGDPPGVPAGKLKKDDIKGWMTLVGAVYKR